MVPCLSTRVCICFQNFLLSISYPTNKRGPGGDKFKKQSLSLSLYVCLYMYNTCNVCYRQFNILYSVIIFKHKLMQFSKTFIQLYLKTNAFFAFCCCFHCSCELHFITTKYFSIMHFHRKIIKCNLFQKINKCFDKTRGEKRF